MTGETNQEKVAELRKQNPNMRVKDIAGELGITRQYASLILKALGLPTTFYMIRRYCSDCGRLLSRCTQGDLCRRCNDKHRRVELVCPQCGGTFTRTKSYISSRQKEGRKHLFCKGKCRSRYYRLEEMG